MEIKKLKTLEMHNAITTNKYFNFNNLNQRPLKNGIACPKCGEELLDSNPNMTLTSYPPKKNIHCEKCDYRGYRIA